jgi:hypothetical protein
VWLGYQQDNWVLQVSWMLSGKQGRGVFAGTNRVLPATATSRAKKNLRLEFASLTDMFRKMYGHKGLLYET